MTAIDELLTLLKEQGFEHYKHEVPAEEDCVAFYDGNRWHDCWESVDGEVNVTFSMMPQEAIAATVGDTDATPTRQGDADLAADNARLRVFASCAYGIASEFIRLNGCPYYDNEMECSLSDECEEKDLAEQPDCLLDALAKALGIEVDA